MSRFLNPAYCAMEAYVPGEQPVDKAYIKLNTNESPFPPAASVVNALKEEDIESLRLYSDPVCAALKNKLAALYGVKMENIFLGNGSDEILSFAFMAFSPKSGVAFPDITYGFYSVYSKLYGAEAHIVPLEPDFSLDYNKFCALGKMIVIANPNAPTGLSIPVSQIERILITNPDHVVLVDEAYVDFGGESCYPLIDRYENLLVVRTFSKSRCLAGARLGYAFGAPGLICDLEKLRFSVNPYNINRLTLRLGEATVEAEDYYQQRCRQIIEIRRSTANRLADMGFFVLPSDTNFLFAMTEKMDGFDLYQNLKNKGILVRHFSAPRTSPFVRITIGTQEQMDALISAIREILEENNDESC